MIRCNPAVGHELAVRTSLTVVRGTGWGSEQLLHKRQVETDQERSMKQQGALPAPLGIPRKFAGIKCKVSVTFHRYAGAKCPAKCPALACHDGPVGAADAGKGAVRHVEPKRDGIIQ